GCYVSQCRPIRYYPNPVVELQDMDVCIKNAPFSLNSMVLKPFVKTGGIETYRCLSVPSTSTLDKNSIISTRPTVPVSYDLNTGTAKDTQDVGTYVIEYCFKNAVSGCQTCDTANVNVKRYGQAYISNLPKACINGGPIDLDSFVAEKYSGSKLAGNTWSCVEYAGSRDRTNPNVKQKLDSSVKNNQFYPKTGSGQYMLKCSTDPNACAASDSIYITVNGLPLVRIDVPDTVCASDTMVLLQNTVPAGKVGKWTGPGVSGWHLNASLLNLTRPVDGPFKMKFTYTNPFTACTSSDSQNVLVAAKPVFKPKAVVHKIYGKYYVDFSITNGSFVDTSKQKGRWQFGNGKGSSYFTNNYVMIQDSGRYTAYFSLSNGPCTYTDSVSYVLDYRLTGTDQLQDLLMMYPNPVSDELNVRVPADGHITITDIRGVVVYQSLINADTTFRISTKEFAAGQYILTISGDASEIRRLFIKQ
ncbi:MAG: T9SS type A sorting domain-containing protein, partial [Chitinophagaceae bacterium]